MFNFKYNNSKNSHKSQYVNSIDDDNDDGIAFCTNLHDHLAPRIQKETVKLTIKVILYKIKSFTSEYRIQDS